MFEKLKDIRTFIFDVDGVLTNGNILVTETGEQLRSFNTKDGYALQLAVKKGYQVYIISGGSSTGVLKRLNGLGINQVYLGVHHKIEVYNKILAESDINHLSITFVGDDIPDYQVMSKVGFAVCPADAAEEIKKISHYISPKNGGEGVARDIIEKVLKIQGNWNDTNPDANDGGEFKKK